MDGMALCVTGTIWSVICIALLAVSGKKYQDYIDVLDGNEYFMKQMYGVGYCLLELFKVDFNAPFFQKKMNKLSEMYDKKRVRLLVISDFAAQLTYIVTLVPIGILVAIIMDELFVALIMAMFAVFLAVYIEYDKNTKVNQKRAIILKDFPHVLSQMALLVNAGMPLREVLETVAKSKDSVFYTELRILTDDLKNGIPDYEAFHSFADRCGVSEVRKLSSLIIQNVKKGSSELAGSLMELSNEVWRNRTAQVREEGEKASSKLLIPILIIFGGIIIMVVVPIFINMGL